MRYSTTVSAVKAERDLTVWNVNRNKIYKVQQWLEVTRPGVHEQAADQACNLTPAVVQSYVTGLEKICSEIGLLSQKVQQTASGA